MPVKWKYARPLQGKENGRKKETDVKRYRRKKEGNAIQAKGEKKESQQGDKRKTDKRARQERKKGKVRMQGQK